MIHNVSITNGKLRHILQPIVYPNYQIIIGGYMLESGFFTIYAMDAGTAEFLGWLEIDSNYSNRTFIYLLLWAIWGI